jgi:hypothetical protein
VRECSVIIGWTRKGRWIFEVARYLNVSIPAELCGNVGEYRINSNSPSGGMKEIVLSESNLPNFTHWWN